MKKSYLNYAVVLMLAVSVFSCGSAEKTDADEAASGEETEEAAVATIPEPAAEYEINDFLKAVGELPADKDGWNGKVVTVTGPISEYLINENTGENGEKFFSFKMVVDSNLCYKALCSDRKYVSGMDRLFSVELSPASTGANPDWSPKSGEIVKVKATFENKYPANISLKDGEIIK